MDTKASTRKATISAKVFRKATGKWEDLGVIARPKVRLTDRILKFLKGGK